jgi:nicotinamide mononucleotide transporter
MTWIELAATIFGLLCVWFTVKQNIWCWPTGIVQVFLYIFVFYGAKLYSDALLQVIYIFLQAYGWYHWNKGNQHQLPVTNIPKRNYPFYASAILLGSFLWGYTMKRYTDAAAPYPDAFIVVASLVATWLLAKKKVESWYLWISVDVIAIGVYAYKHLYLTTSLYAVFLVLATMGLLEWKKSLRSNSSLLNWIFSKIWKNRLKDTHTGKQCTVIKVRGWRTALIDTPSGQRISSTF